MATLAEPIAMDFGSLTLLAWLATAYLIGTAATQPLAGKLTDIYSRRTGLLVSNLLFGTGNLICAIAPNSSIMITGRALAGMGGGGLNTISTLLISDLVPLRKRGLYQGYGNLFWGVGSGLGGLYGGSLRSLWNWRLAFIAQLPFTLLSIAFVFIHVKKLKSNGAKPLIYRVDFAGCLLLVSFIVVLLMGLNSGGSLLPWKHPLILSSFLLSAVLFSLFTFVEENVAKEPVVPIRLMGNRTVACVCLNNFFLTMAVYCFLYYIPVYVRLRGFSDKIAGAVLLPHCAMLAIGSLLAGIIISKTGKLKLLNIFILISMLCASTFIYTCSPFTPIWVLPFYMALLGTSFGGTLTTTLSALVGWVQPSDEAVAISLSYAFRSTASVVGVAAASAAFQNVLSTNLWAKFGDRGEEAPQIIQRITENSDLGWLSWHDQQLTKSSFMKAVTAVFLSAVAFSSLGLLSGMLIKDPPGLSRKGEEQGEGV